MPSYDIKITPQKEKNTALINILLKDADWKDYALLLSKMEASIAPEHLLKKEITNSTTLLLEISYSMQEEIAQTLESLISSEGTLKLSKRQIYILKLGGWFDY